MTKIVELSDGRKASYEVVGSGQPTMMFPGGPGFAAAYMRADAELFSDRLRSFLIDPHGSGASTPPPDPEGYTPQGHAGFYEEIRQALGLDSVVVLGHSFGATTALTYCALFPAAVVACVASAAFGVSPEIEDVEGNAAQAEHEAMLDRHADAFWYAQARSTMDHWKERILATDDPAEMEQMMGTVLPLYLAHPDQPEVVAALSSMREHLTADLAAGKAWENGLYQTIDLRPLLPRISCPTLVIAGELDFICGPAQAQPISHAIEGARLALIPDCGHFLSIESPVHYRREVLDFLSNSAPGEQQP